MVSLLLSGSIFNLVIFLVSIIYTKRWRATTFYFNLCLSMCFWAGFCAYLNLSQLTAQFSHTFRTGLLGFYIFLGSGLLFTKKSFTKNTFSGTDLLYFIPALFFLIDHAPFYAQSAEYKRVAFEYDFSHQLLNAHKQGWLLPPNIHFRLRFFVGTITALYQLTLIYKVWQRHDKSFINENNALIKWIFIYSLLLLMALSTQAVSVFNGSVPDQTRLLDAIPTFFLIFSFPTSLLFNPEILYGTKGFWSEDNPKAAQEIPNAPPKVYFDARKAKEMADTLNTFMENKKPFLNPDYNLTQLASDFMFPVRHVSSLLNNFLDVSVNDYINQFRVRHFIERYQFDPEARKITFEALAFECGFYSRYTFINAFKKYTGKTPSQYFDNISG